MKFLKLYQILKSDINPLTRLKPRTHSYLSFSSLFLSHQRINEAKDVSDKCLDLHCGGSLGFCEVATDGCSFLARVNQHSIPPTTIHHPLSTTHCPPPPPPRPTVPHRHHHHPPPTIPYHHCPPPPSTIQHPPLPPSTIITHCPSPPPSTTTTIIHRHPPSVTTHCLPKSTTVHTLPPDYFSSLQTLKMSSLLLVDCIETVNALRIIIAPALRRYPASEDKHAEDAELARLSRHADFKVAQGDPAGEHPPRGSIDRQN
ncbi:hypothetical protein QVD17_28533 [Tagetes erecta]|uniref:Uncharacterized protein n=1 Tax=Tagetes erecta TaxID=13708 RepID=A0AAD8KF78_TARER|nr:hypothetical protein QVD17_28533 [Tagetes erecta]